MPGWLIIVLAAAVILYLGALFVEAIPDPDPLEYDEDWEEEEG